VEAAAVETAAIEDAARKAGVLTFVGYNYRWAPVVQYARQLIESGKLGSLTHYRGRFLVDYGSNPDGVLSWRFQRELAGPNISWATRRAITRRLSKLDASTFEGVLKTSPRSRDYRRIEFV